MSQSSPLVADVASWSRQQCQEKFDEALPILITQLNGEENIKETLELLCRCFVPITPLQSLEECIVSKIAEKVLQQFEGLLQSIEEVVCKTENLQEVATQQLVDCEALIQSWEGLVRHTVSMVGEGGVAASSLTCLSNTSLIIIAQSYTHCKDSGRIYGEWLGRLTEELSRLFKAVHSLQMSVIALVDRLSLMPATKSKDIPAMCSVLCGLQEVGTAAHSLDVKIMVTVWRTISRLAMTHSGSLRGSLDVGSLVAPLVANMSSSLLYLSELLLQISQDGGKVYARNIKLIGFQMKILTTLVCEFAGELLTESIPSVCLLLASLHSHVWSVSSSTAPLPDSCSAPLSHITTAVDQLLQVYLPLPAFIHHCLSLEENGWVDYPPIVQCFCLISLTNLLSKADNGYMTAWGTPSPPSGPTSLPLLQALFSLLPLCHSDLLAGTRMPDLPSSGGSLYDLIHITTCHYITATPSSLMPHLDELLLENLLSREFYGSCLAGDLFYHVARCLPEEALLNYLDFFIKLLQTTLTPTNRCCHLVALVRRLMGVLEEQQQVRVIRQLTFDTGLLVCLPMTLTQQQHAGVSEAVCQLQRWCCQMTRADMFETVTVLISLSQLYNNQFTLTSSHTLPDLAFSILTSISAADIKEHPLIAAVLTAAMRFSSCISAGLSEGQVSEVLHKTGLLLQSSGPPSDHLQLSVLDFLRSLAARKFSPCFEQTKILQQLPRLLSWLLSNSNPVIQQRALCVFSQYAEETPHESIVPDSLSATPTLQHTVMAHFNLMSGEQTMSAPNREDLVDFTEVASHHWALNIDDTGAILADDPDNIDLEPTAKRVRLDAAAHKQTVLPIITGCLESVVALRQTGGTLPQQVHSALTHLQEELAALLNTV